jgi:hypothetical protein
MFLGVKKTLKEKPLGYERLKFDEYKSILKDLMGVLKECTFICIVVLWYKYRTIHS